MSQEENWLRRNAAVLIQRMERGKQARTRASRQKRDKMLCPVAALRREDMSQEDRAELLDLERGVTRSASAPKGRGSAASVTRDVPLKEDKAAQEGVEK